MRSTRDIRIPPASTGPASGFTEGSGSATGERIDMRPAGRSLRWRAVVAAVAAAALLPLAPGRAASDVPGKPGRIVSLNMCVDELLLRLAEPRNVASVTWLSRDPNNSNVAELAE